MQLIAVICNHVALMQQAIIFYFVSLGWQCNAEMNNLTLGCDEI